MKISRILKVAGLTCLLATGRGALAQQGSSSLPSLSVGTIYIWNGTNKPVVFYLSSDNQNFMKFRLDADKADSPDFGSATKTVYFRAKTGDTIIERTLDAQQRYRLVFVQPASYIDIQIINK
jgi:hypothetical protein